MESLVEENPIDTERFLFELALELGWIEEVKEEVKQKEKFYPTKPVEFAKENKYYEIISYLGELEEGFYYKYQFLIKRVTDGLFSVGEYTENGYWHISNDRDSKEKVELDLVNIEEEKKFDPRKPYKFRNKDLIAKIIYISPFDEEYPYVVVATDYVSKDSTILHYNKDWKIYPEEDCQEKDADWDLVNIEEN